MLAELKRFRLQSSGPDQAITVRIKSLPEALLGSAAMANLPSTPVSLPPGASVGDLLAAMNAARHVHHTMLFIF